MDYISEVFRFGGANPHVDSEGNKRNLRHDWTNAFSPDEMNTDGRGHVGDQPLLRNKSCFGRPEAYLRQGIYDVRYIIDHLGETRQCYTPCDHCPVRAACQHLVIERLESSPPLLAAYCRFDDAVPHGMHSPFLHSILIRRWVQFLHAIKAHGGWTNVNDARVSADNLVRQQRRIDERRLSARRTRAKNKRTRLGIASVQSMTALFIKEVNAERDRRFATLMDLRTQPRVPPWISKLPLDGCARTADVWRFQAILTWLGQRPTGKSIAQMLIQDRRVTGVKLGSLTTWVCKDRKRIEKLESDHAGDPVWEPFRSTC